MSWIRDIFSGQQKREAAQQQEQTANASKIGGGTYTSRIVQARDPQIALTVSAVHRAIELRAKTIGQMPVQMRKKDELRNNFQPWMTGLGKRINYLLQYEPNPIMTASSLWEQVTINRLQYGNAFVYIERDAFGDPLHLWLSVCGGYNIVTGRYNLTYLSEYGIVNLVDVPKEDVMHFPNTYRYQNGFWGISTLQYAADTLKLIKTQKEQALDTAAKGGRVKGFITEDLSNVKGGGTQYGRFNKQTTDDYAKEINDKVYQQDIVALRGLEKFTNVSMTMQDQALIEQLNLGMDDVARFFATPRPLLMLDTNSHYNDYKNATMEYLQRTIAPDARQIEDELNRKLLTMYDFGKFRFHLCELPLLRMDLESQAKVDQLHLQMGWTVNEIRAQYDMASVKDGDISFRTANVKPLNGAEDGGQTLAPGNYTVPAPEPKKDEKK